MEQLHPTQIWSQPIQTWSIQAIRLRAIPYNRRSVSLSTQVNHLDCRAARQAASFNKSRHPAPILQPAYRHRYQVRYLLLPDNPVRGWSPNLSCSVSCSSPSPGRSPFENRNRRYINLLHPLRPRTLHRPMDCCRFLCRTISNTNHAGILDCSTSAIKLRRDQNRYAGRVCHSWAAVIHKRIQRMTRPFPRAVREQPLPQSPGELQGTFSPEGIWPCFRQWDYREVQRCVWA